MKASAILLIIQILSYLKDPRLWEVWYTPSYRTTCCGFGLGVGRLATRKIMADMRQLVRPVHFKSAAWYLNRNMRFDSSCCSRSVFSNIASDAN